MAEKLSEFFIHGLQVDCLQSAFSLKICPLIANNDVTIRDTLSLTAARDFVADALHGLCMEKFCKEK